MRIFKVKRVTANHQIFIEIQKETKETEKKRYKKYKKFKFNTTKVINK